VHKIERYSRFKRKFLSFNDFWETVQPVYGENERNSKQADIPIFEYTVYKDLRDIGFVLKFGKDGVCRAPVCETKVNNINAIGDDGDTVYHYKNPFCYILINSVVPEPERNNLHEQIQRISISQGRDIELKSAL
jgi:hypothetical protein